MVFWLLGISGAGKTTLGIKLKELFEESGKDVFLIDGDFVRDFFDNDLGYSKEDRAAVTKRMIFAAYSLSKNNIVTIVCNITPFEELRQFARKKLNGYNQIYLKRDTKTCKENDVKNMYKLNNGKTEIVGIDLQFDTPINNDLMLDTDAQEIDESLAAIKEFIQKKYENLLN